jgi:hypothetical protein
MAMVTTTPVVMVIPTAFLRLTTSANIHQGLNIRFKPSLYSCKTINWDGLKGLFGWLEERIHFYWMPGELSGEATGVWNKATP